LLSSLHRETSYRTRTKVKLGQITHEQQSIWNLLHLKEISIVILSPTRCWLFKHTTVQWHFVNLDILTALYYIVNSSHSTETKVKLGQNWTNWSIIISAAHLLLNVVLQSIWNSIICARQLIRAAPHPHYHCTKVSIQPDIGNFVIVIENKTKII
jgi:hypothetical protein